MAWVDCTKLIQWMERLRKLTLGSDDSFMLTLGSDDCFMLILGSDDSFLLTFESDDSFMLTLGSDCFFMLTRTDRYELTLRSDSVIVLC